MKQQINRAEAKALAVEKFYHEMEDYDKLKILMHDYAVLSDVELIEGYVESGDLPQLNEAAVQLIKSKSYLQIPINENLKPIFIDHFMFSLEGVANEYLEFVLKEYIVKGEMEAMGTCPCCRYKSLDAGEDGYCQICSVCFWENGGSGPNHMTLEQGQANFKEFGVMDKAFLKDIDPEGRIKFAKD